MARRFLLLLALAAMLTGCSGRSHLYVHNFSNGTISVQIKPSLARYNELDEGGKFELIPGESLSALGWTSTAPRQIDITVTAHDGRTLIRSFSEADYPPLMREGTGLSHPFHLIIDDSEIRLQDPSIWEKFEANGGLFLLSYGSIVALVILAAIRLGGSNRRKGQYVKPHRPD